MSISIGASQLNGINIGASQTDPAAAAGNIKKLGGVAWANVKSVSGVIKSNIKKISGVSAQ